LTAGCLAAGAAVSSRSDALALFARAARHYQDGEFQRAKEVYQSILDAGWESGPVYYNLGNTYYRMGQKGRAIVNYERALRFMPRDGDLRFNYRQASAGVPKFPAGFGPRLVSRAIERHNRFYSQDEMVIILTALATLMVLAGLTGQWQRWPLKRLWWGEGVLAVIFIIFLTGLILKVQGQLNSAFAVAVSEAKFEPNPEATPHFRLREGEAVRVLRSEFGWFKIERTDGQMGWVPAGDVERL
jgi:tetratricopeptide (TPR) repeat protein